MLTYVMSYYCGFDNGGEGSVTVRTSQWCLVNGIWVVVRDGVLVLR